MLVSVVVKPNSKHPGIKEDKDVYIISVSSLAKEGKANKELIKLLAKHFNVSKSCVSIKKGFKSKLKIVEIL